jgi:fructose-1,6-bisphosphatase/sedoheptulose 1,7-bisphosphatase-like protein
MIAQVRCSGARIRLISDGDVGGAIEVAKADAPVDIMMAIGAIIRSPCLHHCTTVACTSAKDFASLKIR